MQKDHEKSLEIKDKKIIQLEKEMNNLEIQQN